MERRRIDGDARFSEQPTEEQLQKSINDFNKVLKECNGDRNKAVDRYNKRNEITAEDMRNLL